MWSLIPYEEWQELNCYCKSTNNFFSMYYNSGALEHLQYKGGKFYSTIYLLEPDSFIDISSIIKKKVIYTEFFV